MSVSVMNYLSQNTSAVQVAVSDGKAATSENLKDFSERSLEVSIARTADEKAQVAAMLNERYAWRGYGANHKIADDQHHSTFVVRLDENVVGTITLGVDSSKGLAVDGLFKDELKPFRNAPGAQVCELSKFAFDIDDKASSNMHLACLFHAVFLFGIHYHNCTDLFIEVNPRHRRFYHSMLGFKSIGELRINSTVNAPSQLMWLNISDVAEKIAYHRGCADEAQSRSLYSQFLSEADEASIKTRLGLQNTREDQALLFKRTFAATDLKAFKNDWRVAA